jgi:hypothetical protein
MTRVLVVGVPRSGTTWVAQVLCAASGASYVEEPDNHFRFAFAYRAKRKLGRGTYPDVEVGESDLAETEFGSLWRYAFAPDRPSALQTLARGPANRLVTLAGPRRTADTLAGTSRDARLSLAQRLAVPEQAPEAPPRLVVKSVYAPLCAEWVSSRYATGTVVVVRSPLEIVASWVALGWLGSRWPDPLSSVPLPLIDALRARYAAPAPPESRLGRAAWLIGVLQGALEHATRRNPLWARVEHEGLYRSPLEEFPRLAAAVGLPWSEAGDRVIEQGRRPGKGYDTRRVTSQLEDAWRIRLSDEDAREVRDVLDRLPWRAM